MQLLLSIAGFVFVGVIAGYMYSFLKFYGIVKSEKPEWVQRRGSLSFFYDGLPRAFDPNVTVAVIRTAFSSRIHRLNSPMATSHATRIRILGPAGVVLFIAILFGVFASAP